MDKLFKKFEPNKNPVLSAKGLCIGYTQENAIAHDLNFELLQGESLALIGGNGSGKTTLLKTIAGLVRPLAGEIKVCTDLKDHHQNISWLGQFHPNNPVLPLRALDVVKLAYFPGRGLWNPVTKLEMALVDEAIRFVGLSDYAKTTIDRLSGGQRQRVFLAYSIIRQSPLVLLDEPSQNLDKAGIEILGHTIELWKQHGTAVVIATHDAHEAEGCDHTINFSEEHSHH